MKKKSQTAALAALAVMMALAAACGSGSEKEPEDRISAGDWRRFIKAQMDMIARGRTGPGGP